MQAHVDNLMGPLTSIFPVGCRAVKRVLSPKVSLRIFEYTPHIVWWG